MTNTLQQKIKQKAEELRSLQDVKRFTGVLANQLEQIEQKLDCMADGAESVALILSSWKNVVNSVSLASLGLVTHTNTNYQNSEPLPETLVRINLRQDSSQSED